MDQSDFERISPMLDEIAETADRLFDSAELATVRELLAKISEATRCSASLAITVDIFDDQPLRQLPLLTTGLTSSEGKPPHRTWGDSSVHRYLVDREIKVVPHDRCPRCWDSWDFKFLNASCKHCSAALGVDVKILVDSDVCPYCDEGRISSSNPVCNLCGFAVDPAFVHWG